MKEKLSLSLHMKHSSRSAAGAILAKLGAAAWLGIHTSKIPTHSV